MALLVRIKRKLNEEPLESVVLGRQSNPKRANVSDLRQSLKDASLNGPQVFRLLSTGDAKQGDNEGPISLPQNLLETIDKRKKEWQAKTRRSSPRKSVKTTFDQPRATLSTSSQARIEGQLQQSRSQRQARVWSCRRVKVQGFSVLEFTGDEKEKEIPISTSTVEPWVKRQSLRKVMATADRLKEIEQETKARTTVDTKSLKRAKGWRQWQDQHRVESTHHAGLSSQEDPIPQQYADLLKEYFGERDQNDQPVNFYVSSSSSSSASVSASSSVALNTVSHMDATSSSDRDYVWDLYYCFGTEQDVDPNAVELNYETEEPSDAESEDSNAKEHDYSDEESSGDEGEESDEENSDDDSDGVMNKRMTRWKDEDGDETTDEKDEEYD